MDATIKKTDCYIDYKLILLSTFIGIMNSYLYSNKIIMFALCVFEVIVLFYNLFTKKYMNYSIYYVIFLCFSMESSTFVGTENFYGFKNFRILGINLAVLCLIPAIILVLFNFKNLYKNLNNIHKKIIKYLGIFTIFGIILGIITYLLDLNGMRSKEGSLSQLISIYYSYIIVYVMFITFSFLIVKDQKEIYKMKQALYSIIIGISIVLLFCSITKNYGNRGGLKSLQVSEVYFLLVSSIILLSYSNFKGKDRLFLLLSSIVILILTLMYNASGKIIILTMIAPILIIFISYKRENSISKGFHTFLLILAFVLFFIYILPFIANNSKLLNSKLQQVLRLFEFKSGNWLEQMPESPKMRILEFYTIFNESLANPLYLFFGKGFGGTITDSLNLFPTLTEFSFSPWELELGAYFNMHESINNFFLIGGILGLIILFKIIIMLLKNIHKSPWILFGILWIVFFYNYHLTIVIYGIISMIVGLIEINTFNKKNNLGGIN